PAQALQLLRREPELDLQVLELRRAGFCEMLQQRVVGVALELRAAERIEQRQELRGNEQVLAAVDGEDHVPARAQLPEPRELRPGPLPEAGTLRRVRPLVASLEEARQR